MKLLRTGWKIPWPRDTTMIRFHMPKWIIYFQRFGAKEPPVKSSRNHFRRKLLMMPRPKQVRLLLPRPNQVWNYRIAEGDLSIVTLGRNHAQNRKASRHPFRQARSHATNDCVRLMLAVQHLWKKTRTWALTMLWNMKGERFYLPPVFLTMYPGVHSVIVLRGYICDGDYVGPDKWVPSKSSLSGEILS